jgi:hypothetical protein
MLMQGRSLGHASRLLTDHLNRILNSTITHKRLSLFLPALADEAQINFREHGSASFAMLRTDYGPMELDLRQTCDVVGDEETGLLTLRTLSYRYTITPEGNPEPLLRWEFVRFPASSDATWCQHHFQGPIRLGIHNREGEEAHLNRWHLPTSGIAIEDVLRFCITDLGVRPTGDNWNQQLGEGGP